MSEKTKCQGWDDRLALDPLFWIVAEVSSREELLSSGERDFAELFPTTAKEYSGENRFL